MASLKERILALISQEPGLTDREITDRLEGKNAIQQPINQAAHQLKVLGKLVRRHRSDGLIGNYPAIPMDEATFIPQQTLVPTTPNQGVLLSEDDLKRTLQDWLVSSGWRVDVKWAKEHGIDIEAFKNGTRWIIEVKGSGSLNAMRVNYFLGILGETLQRMNDPNALYSIALPDLAQFRGLWQRLPNLAKQRTTITALFVSESGKIEEVK